VLPALRASIDHPGVIGNRRVDVDEIDLGIGQDFVVFGVSFVDPNVSPNLLSFSTFRWQIAYMLALGCAW